MPHLSETERIEVLMMIGYSDRRRSCAEVMTLLMTHKKGNGHYVIVLNLKKTLFIMKLTSVAI
jgi:hypothetical protein